LDGVALEGKRRAIAKSTYAIHEITALAIDLSGNQSVHVGFKARKLFIEI